MADVAKPNEASPRGLRSWFSQKLKTKPATSANKNAPPPERKTYVPRYAARDMLMSVPVVDRPNSTSRPPSIRHQSACSDIGFMPTGSSSHSPYSGRPHLMPRNVSMPNALSGSRSGTSTPRSIQTSYSYHGSSTSLSAGNFPSSNTWRGFDREPGPSTPRSLYECQLGPEASQRPPLWNIPDQASSRTSLSELERPPHRRKSSASSFNRAGFAATHHNYAPARTVSTGDGINGEQSYFSHKGGIPNIRRKSEGTFSVPGSPAPVDKGKGRASSEITSSPVRPAGGSMYGYHGEMRQTAPSRLRNEHFLEPVFDEESESDDGLYLRRPTTATSAATPSRRHSPSGHSPSRVYSTLYEQQEPSSDEHKHTNSADSEATEMQAPPALQTESSSASFIESTTSEAPTDLSKRSASTVSTAPTEGSVTDSRPHSQFKEQESQSASSETSPECGPQEAKHSEAAKLGIQVIQYEPEQPSLYHAPISLH
jgi:hypothetical protein